MHGHVFISMAHVPFAAEWTIPTVSGDIPPPMAYFSLTQIANNQAVLFGGLGPGGVAFSELRLATAKGDSVVSM